MKQKLILSVIGIAVTALLVFTTCKLEVNAPIKKVPLIKPYISVQPKSELYELAGAFNPASLEKLSIKLADWDITEGDITCQWYMFSSLTAFATAGNSGTAVGEILQAPYIGTPLPQEGEEGDTIVDVNFELDLSTLIPTAAKGNKFYFYAEVTNKKDDVTSDEKTATIRSNIATISFINQGDALPPAIIKDPVNATYQMGRSSMIAPLAVTAESPALGGGQTGLTYQWYISEEFSNTGGTKIDENGTYSSYEIVLSTLNPGAPNYFYVVVTYTDIGDPSKSSSEASFPAIIQLNFGERAMEPVITLQPEDQVYFFGDTVKALTVEGESQDAGTITYQWYSASTATATVAKKVISGSSISGATSATFTPPVNTSSARTNYYYAVVTNTQNGVTGSVKTTTARSNIVTVRVKNGATPVANATITITPGYNTPGHETDRYQYIRGFGGMDVAWANFPETTANDTELQYNPDWGMGYNILRIMIVPQGTQSKKYESHENTVQELMETHRPQYLNNVRIVNKYNGFVLASPWTPPAIWKSNNSINSGGVLKESYYDAFADYLKSFAQYMYNQGAPIYAISIANEPNYSGGYDGCEWNDVQMRDFWKKVGHFTDGVRGFGGGQVIPSVLTMNGESANTPEINFATLADPDSRAAVDLYARHVYGEQRKTLWESPYASYHDGGDIYQTECWMTEHNINSANPVAFPNDSTWNYVWRFMNDVDLVIRLNNENAFVWWAGKRFYSFVGDGQASTVNGLGLPRGWGLSHYAKYTNGFTRVRFTMTGTDKAGTPIGSLQSANGLVNQSVFSMDNTSAKITAYVSPDGNEISLVMWTPTLTNGTGGYDMGTIEIKMPADFTVGSAKGIRSISRNSVHMPMDDIDIAPDRKSAFVTLGRSQIVSVKFTKQQ